MFIGKIVGRTFAIIIISTVLMIILNVSSYMARVWALDDNVNALKTTLNSSVAENNYLTDDAYNMYMSLLQGIQSRDPKLILDYSINYGNTGVENEDSVSPNDDLSVPKSYNSTRKIQIVIHRRSAIWGSINSDGAVKSLDDLKVGWGISTEYYETQVPCLRSVK